MLYTGGFFKIVKSRFTMSITQGRADQPVLNHANLVENLCCLLGNYMFEKGGKANSPAQLPNIILPNAAVCVPKGLPNLPQTVFQEEFSIIIVNFYIL